MKFASKVSLMLNQAMNGQLGTPENPNRSNSLHHAFWVGYFGHTIHRPNKGTTTYPAFRAGQLFRRKHDEMSDSVDN